MASRPPTLARTRSSSPEPGAPGSRSWPMMRAQALGEHADEFVIGRLLAGEVLIEDRLRHAGAGDNVADPGMLEAAFGEFRRGHFQKLQSGAFAFRQARVLR